MILNSIKKIIFLFCFFPSIFIIHSGCFPREDVYINFLNKTEKPNCLSIKIENSCIGHKINIQNNCKDIIIYDGQKKVELTNKIFELQNFPKEVGTKWTEKFYYKNNPKEKILLHFENVSIDLKYKIKQFFISIDWPGVFIFFGWISLGIFFCLRFLKKRN